MKKLFLIVTLLIVYLLAPAGTAKAQIYSPPDSCLKMVCPHDPDNGYYNWDSIKVDSCVGSPTFNRWYAKKYYYICFKDSLYVFESKHLNIDTAITWTGIDTSFHEIRNSFHLIEQIFGEFIIKRFPYYSNDNAFLRRPVVNLEFKNYFFADSVINFISKIEGISLCCLYREPTISNVIDNYQNENFIMPFPNPTSDFLEISLPSELPQGKIEIFSIEGIKIFEIEAVKRIDVSSLAVGVYFVKVGGCVGRFVKI